MPGAVRTEGNGAGPSLARRLFRRRVIVRDESMRPTLEPGDRLFVDTRTLRTRPPRVGEIVVLRDPENSERWLIKRVASVDPSGERVEVLGDAPERARDSRQFGPVPRASLVGIAYFRYAPASRRGDV
jgi:nickel-type superoxide dismutase maturation protease